MVGANESSFAVLINNTFGLAASNGIWVGNQPWLTPKRNKRRIKVLVFQIQVTFKKDLNA